MIVHVDDPDDARLDDYRHLTDREARRALPDAPHGVVVVEGLPALQQLLAGDLVVRSVLLGPNRSALAPDLADSVPLVMVAPRELLAATTGFDVHRGVLAAAAAPAPPPLGELVRGRSRLVVADGVSDAANVGAIVRNAAATGMQALLADRASADPLSRRAVRVSSGWSLRLPLRRGGETVDHLAHLRRAGIATVALVTDADATPVDLAARTGVLGGRWAAVVGSEGHGLGPEVVARCSSRVRIPMPAEVDSFNVATALAVTAAFAAAARGWS